MDFTIGLNHTKIQVADYSMVFGDQLRNTYSLDKNDVSIA